MHSAKQTAQHLDIQLPAKYVTLWSWKKQIVNFFFWRVDIERVRAGSSKMQRSLHYYFNRSACRPGQLLYKYIYTRPTGVRIGPRKRSVGLPRKVSTTSTTTGAHETLMK